MKNIHAIIIIAIALVLNSCGSVYKKHYGNGFTFIKHNKKENPIKSNKNKDLQEHSIALLNDDIKKEKEKEQKVAEENYQTYHKYTNKIQNNVTGRILSSINKVTLKKIDALKPDTIYRKEPASNDILQKKVEEKANDALTVALFSLVAFLTLSFLSLIPAFVAISMAQKAEAMAKLNGKPMPSDAHSAKTLAFFIIGLNALLITFIFLYIVFIVLLIALFTI